MTAAPDWVALLEKVLTGAPALPGARCRGRHHLFDAAASGEDPDTVSARHAQALRLCLNSCPSLTRCESWFRDLKPSNRPTGVVAGQVWEDGKPKSERPPGRLDKAVDVSDAD